ncbi:MAG: alpha/beta fold hydrolase [Gammaproteobacteria bacterium]|jgi:pimeloyl-ACP methyl ester carboxylesterase
MPELNYNSSGSGQPLVVLHGLFGSGRNWQSLARRLAQSFEVFNVDLRNHGQSFHADEMNYPAMAGDVTRLIRRLGIGPSHLLGHSMGGKVAMALALAEPELVADMVIADIAPVSYAHDHDELIDAVLGLSLDAIASRADADRALESAIPEPGLRGFLLQNLVRGSDGWRWRVNWQAIRRNMHNLTGFIDLPADWRIDLRTLFIRGANSDYVDDEAAEQIRQHFDNAEIAIVENAGHWLHAEQPQAFIERVLEFLLPGK